MTLRSVHGRAKQYRPAGGRIEVLAPDELPEGVAALQRPPEPDVNRRSNGTVADSEAARELGRRGGEAKKGTTRLGSELGLGPVMADPEFKGRLGLANAFAKHQVRELANTVGGGVCPAAASSCVQSAALQTLASRIAFERGDYQQGSRLANDARQNLLAAFELTAKMAQARPKQSAIDAFIAAVESDAKSAVETTGEATP
jgi:hypothetical protein